MGVLGIKGRKPTISCFGTIITTIIYFMVWKTSVGKLIFGNITLLGQIATICRTWTLLRLALDQIVLCNWGPAQVLLDASDLVWKGE